MAYREVIQKIETIFGRKLDYHSITQNQMRLKSRKANLLAELRTKNGL